ncbi:hypothetical protein AB0F18_31120, partial [Streptomyces sp. NPDC029216]
PRWLTPERRVSAAAPRVGWWVDPWGPGGVPARPPSRCRVVTGARDRATGRLERSNRILLWRVLTADDDFDLDHWVTAPRPPRAP